MKYLWAAALMVVMLPAVAEAGGRWGGDRGHRYSGHGHKSSGWGVGVSFGYSSGWHGGYGTFGYGYSSSCYRPVRAYCPPVYRYPVCYSPPVVYSAPVVYSPPVYYSSPAYYSSPVYYSAPACEPRYYSSASVYYYNR